MALKYKGKIVSSRLLKKKVKETKTTNINSDKYLRKLRRANIWFIGDKPKYYLYEGKIIKEHGVYYDVSVKARRLKVIEKFTIEKKKVSFE